LLLIVRVSSLFLHIDFASNDDLVTFILLQKILLYA